MKNILKYSEFNEGRHGKYEIWGKKNKKEKILDYASNPETAKELEKEWGEKGWETYIKEGLLIKES